MSAPKAILPETNSAKLPNVGVIEAASPNPDFLRINPLDRTHVFIDGNNLMGMLRFLDLKLDYKKFMLFLCSQTRLVRAHYFALVRDDMPKASEGVIDMIQYAGFDVTRKFGKEAPVDGGHFRFRGSVVPEMIVSMIDSAPSADHIVLVSGDGELYAGIEAVKARGCRVTIIGIKESMSDDLRRTCDSFIDMDDLPDQIFY